MEEMQVMVAKNGKRKWSPEQKLAIVGEFEGGVNAEELCRKYNINKQMLYKWKRSLESSGKEGLKNNGEIVARSQYLAALKKIDDLERALGRKALELDILKKSFELKGLKLPDGI
jgi:transposase-like protein